MGCVDLPGHLEAEVLGCSCNCLVVGRVKSEENDPVSVAPCRRLISAETTTSINSFRTTISSKAFVDLSGPYVEACEEGNGQ